MIETRFRTGTEQTRTDTKNTEAETQTEDEHAEQVCPECGGRLIEDGEHGETVCTDCGLVVDEDAIDHGPDWRAFDSQERNEKNGLVHPRPR